MEMITACVLMIILASVMLIALKLNYELEYTVTNVAREALRAVKRTAEPRSIIKFNSSTYSVIAGISEAMDRGP